MRMLILVIVLGISLYVLHYYVTMGEHSRTHRLLPLILGLISLSDFYQIVEQITGNEEIFHILEDLLLVQMLYLILYYVMDLLQLRFSILIQRLLFFSLVMADITMFFAEKMSPLYYIGYHGPASCYIAIILYISTKAYIRNEFRKQERYVNLMMYLSLVIPSIALIVRRLIVTDAWGGVLVPLGLCATCCIIYYLMRTQQLVDAMTLMQENLYDTSDIALVLFDEDYYYLDANSAARRLFPRELGESAKRGSKGSYAEQLSNALEHPNEYAEFTVGDEQYYQCNLVPVVYRNHLKGYILFLVNITKQKKETQLMEKMKERAQEQERAKSRFLACMSHDLRSPLHAIIGVSDIMLANPNIEGRNRSLMRYVQSAGNTLLELVNSILLFSKLESGKLELVKEPYDIEKILDELTNMCILNLQNKPVHFSIALLSEHPAFFLGDGIRVREMIQNLLSNAVKYTEKGEIRCEINCIKQDNRYLISCMVMDTGPGMDREQMEHTFDEYFSFADAKAKEGTGLGLSIVRRLARKMGGDVVVQSDGSSGSVVGFMIYQEPAPEGGMRPPVTFTEETIMNHSQQRMRSVNPRWVYPGARVLLADDMKVNQEVFKDLVYRWRFVLDTVSSGKEAIEAAQEEDYQLIFLDMRMTDMTGIEAAQRIRKRSDVPLVLVTANVSDNEEENCKEQGFDAFLSKPINMERLQEVIEGLMPASYRQVYISAEDESNTENSIGYRRTLEAFAAEANPLMRTLSSYAVGNHELFKTKVHGIKGASRQIGKTALSEAAEIMEMAAKTDNYTFVENHLEQFLGELDSTLQEINAELARMPARTDTITLSQENTPVEALFSRLREGFENYNMAQIEDNIYALAAACLSEEDRRLFDKVSKAYEELEYEEGAALLQKFT